ncbi:MAG: hypothetical protein HKO66_13305 [Saprospiraceae bacterium]|nr:hypothetical protein [Bacteroidia bacterium]NNE15177.1 hypothetical protein [Saprospiraceae bacterium]NNL93211.1 hypothetical protein [Saprospiraceae bacterium]
MKIVNENFRILNVKTEEVSQIFSRLATKNDIFWPIEKWPPMKLDKGFEIGSKGGHGPIRYSVAAYTFGKSVKFKFTKPIGFNGFHMFEVLPLNNKQTQIKHVIEMNANGRGIFLWFIGIKWLHEALIQDAFDKVENYFQKDNKETPWNIWVHLLRFFLK